ncbi:MAG: hypothetical protein IJ685_03260 [Selenomonadaceae bacterium]|nr:hypothetical protein [Selenomonadaceae bacterium]
MKIEIDAQELTALIKLLTQHDAHVMNIEFGAQEFIDKNFLADLTDKVSAQLAQQIEECLRIHDA